jgi:hypothetical protein
VFEVVCGLLCFVCMADRPSGHPPIRPRVCGTADFAEQWKAWIKAVGKATKKKGKGLFHPIRLALTGRMSGPDVGEQVCGSNHRLVTV